MDGQSTTVRFDPRRASVQELMASSAHADETNPVQAVADLCLAMCIVGDLADVADPSQYGVMIEAAMPNALKAAASFAAQVEVAGYE